MGKNKHTNCLICGSDKLKKLNRYADNYLVKCLSCGLVFCEPIPSVEELNKYYKTYAYENNYYSPITKHRYLTLLNSFKKYRKTNKILDVGCGNGFFLEAAREQGWEVYGTEYSEKAIEILKEKGIKSYKGKLEIRDFNEESFDVITSFEVLEHINNPQEEIKNFYYLLRNNGILYVTTPNFNSISRDLLKERWDIIGYPEHLTYYSKKTIHKLIKENGFKKNSLKTTGFSISRYRKSKVKNKEKASETNFDEGFREKVDNKLGYKMVFKIVNFLLNLFKKGDSIKAYYIKKSF